MARLCDVVKVRSMDAVPNRRPSFKWVKNEFFVNSESAGFAQEFSHSTHPMRNRFLWSVGLLHVVPVQTCGEWAVGTIEEAKGVVAGIVRCALADHLFTMLGQRAKCIRLAYGIGKDGALVGVYDITLGRSFANQCKAVCERHGTTVIHSEQHVALAQARRPIEWCFDCHNEAPKSKLLP